MSRRLLQNDHRVSPRIREDDGIALILALLFVVLMAAIVVDFSYEMQVDASLVESHRGDFEAYLAAKSAVATGMGVLAGDLFFAIDEGATSGDDVYDSLDEPWAESVPVSSLNDSVTQVAIDDEYGKLNLNALVYLHDVSDEEGIYQPLASVLDALFDSRDVDEIPLDAILDWLDSDDDERPNGAENGYYMGLETPYACKNGPMDSIDELLLIPGITPEVFFGDPDAEEVPLTELLTVHGHPEGKINVNTAEYALLLALFVADERAPDPEAKVEAVMEKLENEGPYMSLEELRRDDLVPSPPVAQAGQPPPAQQPLVILLDWKSSVFRILGDGQSGQSKVRIEAYVWRDTEDSGAEQMLRIVDWRVIR